MAHLFKNDMNSHGARSKTRAVNNNNHSSKKHDSMNGNGCWGTNPNSSRGASNFEDEWGDVQNDSSVSNSAWGRDRMGNGNPERNRKFRPKDSSSFRVPSQSSNWDEVDESFPPLGGGRRSPPPVNVWEKRKEKFELIKAIEPSSQTEEERMIQKAMELSMMETRKEEERRRQLEEEYKLQTQLLEANPDMFEEFREGALASEAYADGFVAESYGAQNGYSEEFHKDETAVKNSIDHGGGWDYTGEDVKKEDLKKHEPAKDDTDSWSQPVSTVPKTNSYAGARPKISKVVDMFGGWGAINPPKAGMNHHNGDDRPASKSTGWKTVDVDFASRPSKQKTAATRPKNELSSPPPPEVKIDNTSSEWDAAETKADTPSNWEDVPSTKNSNWDTVETKIDKSSNWETVESETATKCSNWNTAETGIATERPNLDTHTNNASVHGKGSEEHSVGYQEECTNEGASLHENWNSKSSIVENYKKKCDNDELNSENTGYSSQNKQKASKPVQDIAQLKADLKLALKSKSPRKKAGNKEKISDFDNKRSSEVDKQEYQTNNSVQLQGNSKELSAETKAKIDSIEGKCFDSFRYVESDYAFLLQNIDNKEKCITAPIPNQTPQHNITAPIPKQIQEDFPSGLQNFTDQLSASNIKESTLGFDEYSILQSYPSQEPVITEPHPLSANSQDTQILPPFNRVTSKPSNHDVPLSNDGESNIEPPKAAIPIPGQMNLAFMPQPMPLMNPLMNPALMMGMNPMMMQQMMMFSNPFFMQQLQQMDMYYKSMGMSFGMPLHSQPMPVPTFANNQNPQDNLMAHNGSVAQVEMVPPPKNRSSPPGIDPSHLLIDDIAPADQSENFWFNDLLSSDTSSSLIPPPKPTSASEPLSHSEVVPEAKMNPTDFASINSFTENATATPLSGQFNSGSLVQQSYDVSRSGYDRSPEEQSRCSSSVSVEVPCATGWGDIDEGSSKTSSVTGWDEEIDGWGNGNASAARSMRNPTRHAKSTYRQPSSRPNLGRPKI